MEGLFYSIGVVTVFGLAIYGFLDLFAVCAGHWEQKSTSKTKEGLDSEDQTTVV